MAWSPDAGKPRTVWKLVTRKQPEGWGGRRGRDRAGSAHLFRGRLPPRSARPERDPGRALHEPDTEVIVGHHLEVHERRRTLTPDVGDPTAGEQRAARRNGLRSWMATLTMRPCSPSQSRNMAWTYENVSGAIAKAAGKPSRRATSSSMWWSAIS